MTCRWTGLMRGWPGGEMSFPVWIQFPVWSVPPDLLPQSKCFCWDKQPSWGLTLCFCGCWWEISLCANQCYFPAAHISWTDHKPTHKSSASFSPHFGGIHASLDLCTETAMQNWTNCIRSQICPSVMMLIYLMIHDTCEPLEWRRPESLKSLRLLCGRTRSIQPAGSRWWCGWRRWSVTGAAVVHQHNACNHGDDDDATNPLVLRRHMKHIQSKQLI